MKARVAAHPVFTGLLVAGLVLRVITFFAYRPALIYYDSTRYLDRVARPRARARCGRSAIRHS